MQTHEYVVRFKIRQDFEVDIHCPAHNEIDVVPISKRWLEETHGKVAARQAQLLDIVEVGG